MQWRLHANGSSPQQRWYYYTHGENDGLLLPTTASYEPATRQLRIETDLSELTPLHTYSRKETAANDEFLALNANTKHNQYNEPEAECLSSARTATTLTSTWYRTTAPGPKESIQVQISFGDSTHLPEPFKRQVNISIINEPDNKEEEDVAEDNQDNNAEEDGEADDVAVPGQGDGGGDADRDTLDQETQTEPPQVPILVTPHGPLDTPVVLYGFIQPNRINPNLITLVAITRPTGYEFAFVCRVCGRSGAGKIVLDEHRTEWGQQNAVTMDKPPLNIYGGAPPTLQYLAEIRDPARPHDQLTTYVFT